MYPAERHQRILEAARTDGRVGVTELADSLNVSLETVRRDLCLLEERGLVRRVHGGALPVNLHLPTPAYPTAGRLAFSLPVVTNPAQQRIATRALAEIPPQGTILLDSGSTTQAIAERLPLDRGLTVVTNSVPIAAMLYLKPGVSLYFLGGRVRGTNGATVGTWATGALAEVSVDVAFMGTDGFSPDRGLTTPDEAEAVAKRGMIAAAARAIAVSVSAKLDLNHVHRFARPQDVSLLITDSDLGDEPTAQFLAMGTAVARV